MKPKINLTPLISIALILVVLVMVQPTPSRIEVELPPLDYSDSCVLTEEEVVTLKSQRTKELQLLLQRRGKR